MNAGFDHDVLGEIKADEMFWIFPKRVAAYFVIGMGLAVIFGKMFSWNVFGVIIAILIAALTIALCLMSVIKKPSKEYVRGGSYSYLELLENNVVHSKSQKVMSLCAPLEEDTDKKKKGKENKNV